MDKAKQPVILCILDGWGHSKNKDNNAIFHAKTPTYDSILKCYPNSLIKTSEEEVGLPLGQMGNSEVGHANIGAGRIVLQDLMKINESINNKTLSEKEALKKSIYQMKMHNNICHLIGLVSDGGVHSHQRHIEELARILSLNGIKIYIHAITDGRDTPPKSGYQFIKKFLDNIPTHSKLASISGRYYAMDRDLRWERTFLYYDAICNANATQSDNFLEYIQESYKSSITDEFIEPAIMSGFTGIKDGDGLLIANFRADRIRQILSALLEENFHNFTRKKSPKFSSTVGMTSYSSSLDKLVSLIFPPDNVNKTLGEVVSNSGIKQLRIAETEKYAHVTFFFNGGQEKPFKGEKRILIPSPKVATYDLKPDMSAFELTEKIILNIKKKEFEFIVINYANPDMVGHTGNFEAAITAVEVIDQCINQIVDVISKSNTALLITADHGNIECMIDDQSNSPHTAHTMEKVPLIAINVNNLAHLEDGLLSDIAPTILEILGIKKPKVMTGISLAKYK
tara:strand:- start:1620 stop:3149 length:1530 start_codon:yes stop_codon:yes gene_type:complete